MEAFRELDEGLEEISSTSQWGTKNRQRETQSSNDRSKTQINSLQNNEEFEDDFNVKPNSFIAMFGKRHECRKGREQLIAPACLKQNDVDLREETMSKKRSVTDCDNSKKLLDDRNRKRLKRNEEEVKIEGKSSKWDIVVG